MTSGLALAAGGEVGQLLLGLGGAALLGLALLVGAPEQQGKRAEQGRERDADGGQQDEGEDRVADREDGHAGDVAADRLRQLVGDPLYLRPTIRGAEPHDGGLDLVHAAQEVQRQHQDDQGAGGRVDDPGADGQRAAGLFGDDASRSFKASRVGSPLIH